MEKTLRVLNRMVTENEKKKYPNVTELFKQKTHRRALLGRLSFEEKIAIVNKWPKVTRNIRKSQNAAKPQVTR